MKYENNEYRSRFARALKAAQNLVTLASYRLEDDPVLLPRALREGLNVSDESLTLIPSGGTYPYRLAEAVRETRTAVLIIEPGKTIEGAPTIYFTLVRCARGEVHWHRTLRLWVGPEHDLFLVPAPVVSEPGGLSFMMYRRVRPAETPWVDDRDRDLGLRQGDALLMAP